MKKFAYIVASLALATTLMTGCGTGGSKEAVSVNKLLDDDTEKEEDGKEIEYRMISRSGFWKVLEKYGYSKEYDCSEEMLEAMELSEEDARITYYAGDKDDIVFGIMNYTDEDIAKMVAESIIDKTDGFNQTDAYTEGDAKIYEATSKELKAFMMIYQVDNQVIQVAGPNKKKKKIMEVVTDLFTNKSTKIKSLEDEMPENYVADDEASDNEDDITDSSTKDDVDDDEKDNSTNNSVEESSESSDEDIDWSQEVNTDPSAGEPHPTQKDFIHPTKNYYELTMNDEESFYYGTHTDWYYNETKKDFITGIDGDNDVFAYTGTDIEVKSDDTNVMEEFEREGISSDGVEVYQVDGKNVYIGTRENDNGRYTKYMLQDLGYKTYLCIAVNTAEDYSNQSMVDCYTIIIEE